MWATEGWNQAKSGAASMQINEHSQASPSELVEHCVVEKRIVEDAGWVVVEMQIPAAAARSQTTTAIVDHNAGESGAFYRVARAPGKNRALFECRDEGGTPCL